MNHYLKLLFLLFLSLAGRAAEAEPQKKSVVILKIEGSQGTASQIRLARALRPFVHLVHPKRVQRLAARRALSWQEAKGRVALAQALNLSALILGQITPRGERMMLKTTVYRGEDGQALGTRTFALRGNRLSKTTAQLVAGGLMGLLGRAPPRRPTRLGAKESLLASGNIDGYAHRLYYNEQNSGRKTPAMRRRERTVNAKINRLLAEAQQAEGAAPQDDASASRGASSKDEEDATNELGFEPVPDPPSSPANSAPSPSAPSSASQGPSPGASGASPSETATEARGSDLQQQMTTDVPRQEALELSAGLLAVMRNFSFSSPYDMSNPDYPITYESGVAPGLFVEGGLYPLAFTGGGPLANFGLKGRYWQSIGLQSRHPQTNNVMGTTMRLFETGLHYRWNMLHRLCSPTLNAGLEYGQQSFAISKDYQQPLHLPDVTYHYLKFAFVHLDLPFYATEAFRWGALASFDFLLIFSAGKIESKDIDGYGQSRRNGIDVGGGLYASWKGFSLKLNGFYRRIFYTFDNECQKIGGQPTWRCAGGALDVYLGAILQAGYAF
jgi:hypothetical protein